MGTYCRLDLMLTKGLSLNYPIPTSLHLFSPTIRNYINTHKWPNACISAVKACKGTDRWRVRGCLWWSETTGSSYCCGVKDSVLIEFATKSAVCLWLHWDRWIWKKCVCYSTLLCYSFLTLCHHHQQQCLCWTDFGCSHAWEDQTAQVCAHTDPLLSIPTS